MARPFRMPPIRALRDAGSADREKKTMSQDATSDASTVPAAPATEAGDTHQGEQTPAPAVQTPERQSDSANNSTQSADEEKLGEGGKRALASERQARREAEKQLSELQARLQQFEDRDKSELQRATERAQGFEQQLTTMRETNARLMAAATHNIPPELIDLLGGGTEDEINARAEILAERLKAAAPPPAPASARPVEALTPGAAPASATPASPDAWIRQMAGRKS